MVNKGCIFNIQHYSVHDGPGIRTVVFFKGCPLRCKWCSNPESHQIRPQITYNTDKCIGNECGLCLNTCRYHAVTWDEYKQQPIIQFEQCHQCLKCGEECPAKAISIYGKMLSVDDVIKEAEKDAAFYARSSGGVTFSGGEPLMQHEFLLSCLKACQEKSIDTCIETTLFQEWNIVKEILPLLDTVLIDLKHLDDEKHLAWTGVSNKMILKNLISVGQMFPDKGIVIRTPVVPGFNDNKKDIVDIHQFISDYLPFAEHELLKYHRFGINKYSMIGNEYTLDRTVELNEDHFQEFVSIINE